MTAPKLRKENRHRGLMSSLLFALLAAVLAFAGLRVVAQTPSPAQVEIAPTPDA